MGRDLTRTQAPAPGPDHRYPIATPMPSPAPPREPHLSHPEHFTREPGLCRPFLMQCAVVFELQPSSFLSECSKVAYVISLLSGKARLWATTEWKRQSTICASYEAFTRELCKVFDTIVPQQDAMRMLFEMSQGSRSEAGLAIEGGVSGEPTSPSVLQTSTEDLLLVL
ncbi:hypothetical protein QTP70_004617 [Hemibagrus guttatus]|uniref:DUF4939 domain-containing protein n=1 Tax=Hemibagrus guttatus TaxID=175788 RepID=A0AAE0UM31_9TELE|nr:hypothetical protein QTP70_004617 [Hemibagrus guttatus]